jgi:hypothetical protein
MNSPIPDDWGKDKISDFIERCRSHAFQIYGGEKRQYAQLVVIDQLFRTIQSNLDNTKDWFSGLFFLRAHSSFLGAVSLAMNGQLPEAYMVLRGSIENALYGLYFASHQSSAESWLQRNQSPEMKKKVKEEFKYSDLLQHLISLDPKVGEATSKLYERTIDYGAHPNQGSVMTALRISETETKHQLDIAYISGNILANQLCLRTCAQIGVTVVSIFRNVFKERYDILGVTLELDKLKVKL